MKIVFVGLVLLCMLSLAWAATPLPAPTPASTAADQKTAQVSNDQGPSSSASQSGHEAAVFSRAEADSFRAQGDSLLAQSNFGDIRVGGGGYGLLYVLVVVILVLVILRVAL